MDSTLAEAVAIAVSTYLIIVSGAALVAIVIFFLLTLYFFYRKKQVIENHPDKILLEEVREIRRECEQSTHRRRCFKGEPPKSEASLGKEHVRRKAF